MVSTRGGARTSGPDDSKESSTIRKKPVRKAPAKTAAPAPRAKTTRSKKLEPEPEVNDDDEDEIQLAEPAPKTTRRTQTAKPEPTKRAGTRAKKDEEPVKEAAPKPASKSKTTTTKAATSSTKTARSKAAKDEKPELPPPAPAPAKATRATRATRATAAKERAPPLSPKKITQVSKAAPKTTRTASKAKPPAVQSRPTTRMRRNVSDENADVRVWNSADVESEGEENVQSKPKKAAKTQSKNIEKSNLSIIEDETPASSRPTTPSDGIGQSFDGAEDETAEPDEQVDSESDEGDYTNNTSQDELCGPKTPMKRSSPKFGTQRSSRKPDLDVPSKTPVRRFAVLGTQQGTPQTTKPYRKPIAPLSEVRPTTVSRARDRAMVFPRLQPLSQEVDESQNEQSESFEAESTPVPVDMEVQNEDLGLTMDDTMDENEHEDTLESQPDEESHLSLGQPSHAEDVVMSEDNDLTHEPAEQALDLDETIVLQDEEPESGPTPARDTSFGSNDSVIITLQTSAPENESELEEDMQCENLPTATPKPETLVWENIREDVTIPFNFDMDMTSSKGLPQVEHNDRLSIANGFVSAFEAEPDTVAGATNDSSDEDPSEGGHIHSESNASAYTPEKTSERGRESLDATVNLSDFIDVKSLSESRRQSKFFNNASNVDVSQDSNEDVQQEPSPTLAAVMPASDLFEDEVAVDDSLDETQPGPEEQTTFSPVPSTPAREVSELDIALTDLQQEMAPKTPRYAMPTIASRRKSLPAKLHPGTLFKEGIRPNTSDGVGLMGLATPSRAFTRPKTPAASRPATSHGTMSTAKPTSHAATPRKTPLAKTPGTSVPLNRQTAKKGTPFAQTPISRTLFARTPGTSVPEVATQHVKERFPGLPSRNVYELENAVEPPAKVTANDAVPQERFPAMPPRDNYDSKLETPPAAKSPVPTATTAAKSASKEGFPGLPPKDTYEEQTAHGDAEGPATPQPAAADRYPGLPYRRTYEEHAKTAMPASRFCTPSRSPAKRPATVQKQASLRKVALKASTPTAPTPMKTPLKAPAFTPGQVPMTPHPAAPLRGIVALVEVYTSDGDCATPAFVALLQRLGAKTTKTFSERLTHVVYKEGSPNTLQRLRIHNKQVAEDGSGKEIHCVNSRWVTDCDAQGTRMPESDEAYAVEVEDVPRTAKRRRKSMEPMSLTNIKGSVFRGDRKSSLGKSSLGRSPMKMDSPPEEDKSVVNPEDKENSGDDGSPSTPAYLAAPNSLVQQTAPLNRVRKLDFKSQDGTKNRRLTFWNGGV